MAPKLAFSAVALVALLSGVRATTLTLNDYAVFADGRAKYNPPTCAMPYDSLDLSRITAWSDITSDKDPQCGSCAKVCGSAGCLHLLVVDQCTWGADHLDISTLAGPQIVGSDTGNHVVSMELVDVKNCANIWNGRMFNSWDEPNENLKALQGIQAGVFAPGAASAPATSAAAAAYSTPASSAAAYTPPAVSSTPEVYSSPAPYSSLAATSTPSPYSSPTPEPYSSPAPEPSSPAPEPSSSQTSTIAYIPSAYSLFSSSSSSSSSVQTPSSYAFSTSSVVAVSATSSSAPSSSSVTSYASSSLSTLPAPTGTTLVSVYSSYAPSNSNVAPVPTTNGTGPYTTASPSPIPYTGAGVKTATSLSGLAVSCLLAAMAILT